MSALRQAFDVWATRLDLEELTYAERELLHMMRTVATWEYVRRYRKQLDAAKAAKEAQR